MNLKLWVVGLWLLAGCKAAQKTKLTHDQKLAPAQVVEIIDKVNSHWQTAHPDPGWAFWDVAAYHTGNMAAYGITGNQAYKAYSEKWAEHNKWMGARSRNTTEWKYNYGETNKHVLCGDWQVCFQTYIDLYNLDKIKDPAQIARAKEVMEYQMSTPNKDYWWWADGLYMVMPVMTRLNLLTGDEKYLDKMGEYFQYANSIMYDSV